MKFKLIFISTCATLMFSASCLADANFGSCSHGKENLDSVICYGPAILKDTTVRGNIKVVGPLTAKNVMARSMQVTGEANVENTKVADLVEVTGYLKAVSSHFFKGLTVQGDNVLLNGTIVSGDVTVSSTATKPYFRMQCGSSVTGNVIFGGIAGVVQVSDDSSLVGKIQNGVMEFIRVKC